MKKINIEKIKTWFVTGASSGVGKELCTQLIEKGYNVIAVSRRIPEFNAPNVLCLSVDVTDPYSINTAIEKAIEKFGKIDVLVNNAGISANITLEEETLSHMKEVMETNFFGTFNLLNAILPHFRKNKNGTILCNSSQRGLSCRAFGSAYVSSKHAIEGLTAVCWHETRAFCRVMAFELGYFKSTEIVNNATNIKSQIDEYKNLKSFYKKYRTNFENDLKTAIKYIIETVEKEKLPRRLMLGKDAIIQTQAELKYLAHDLKKSKPIALKCSKPKKKFFWIKK